MFFQLLISIFTPLAKIFTKKVRGLKNLPKQGPYIIAVNHASFADPVFLTVALKKKLKGKTKNIYTIAKRKIIWRLFTLRGSEILFNLLIINPRNKKLVLKRGEKILKKKNVLVIFFEGTRSWTGKLQKGKTGTARLALKLHMPVIPIGLRGTKEFWGRGKILPRYKRNVEVVIGKQIIFKDLFYKKINKKILIKATERINNEIKKLLIKK